MTPYLSDPDVTLYAGDALEVLRELPAESVHCIALAAAVATDGARVVSASNRPKVRRFSVSVHCKPNDLWGSVEVISISRKGAAELAKREFFRGDGWAIVDVVEITKDYERFEGAA